MVKPQQRQTREDIIFDIVSQVLMILGCLVILYPIYFIVIASFSDPKYVLGGEVFFAPRGLNLEGYKRILKYAPLWRGYANSAYYSIAGALLSTFFTLLAAYPLSRNDFSGRKPFTIMLLIAMFFSGGLIPQYILVNALKLRNTYAVLLLISGIQVTNLFIASSYFKTTNIDSLFEASQIDGCTHFGYFFRILLPISVPIVIVMLLFYGVWQWNDFFRALIFLDKQQYFPIQLVLKDLLATNQITGAMFELLSEDQAAYEEMLKAADSMKYGIILFATMPMLILYLFLQQYFIKGITLGSVKG
ncbi:sugar ABC transporter permease [Spirochaetia bacterium]|nr:sugar ABC transporter permease [Spirochaetia bacterium]